MQSSAQLGQGGIRMAGHEPSHVLGRNSRVSAVMERGRRCVAALARRADLGDAEAARLALHMRSIGPRVYGIAFSASAEQLERWRQASGRGEADCAAGLG